MRHEDVAKEAFEFIIRRVGQTQPPKNDERPMERIDREMRGAQAVLDALPKVCRTEMATMRRCRNVLAPISHLPPEILGDIFTQFADDRKDPDQDLADEQYPSRISTLVRVSASWNATVRGTPQIWSNVTTRYPPSFIRTAHRHSATVPLSVELDLSTLSSNSEMEEATLRIIQHLFRWKSATLTAASSADLEILTYTSAPRLRRLVIKCDQAGSAPLNLFAGNAPSVDCVRLAAVPLDGISGILTNLREISLSDIVRQDPHLFFNMLRACPSLTKLELSDFEFSPGTDAYAGEASHPTLSNLKDLHLVDIPVAALNTILLHLNCPAAELVIIAPSTVQTLIRAETLQVFRPTFDFILRILPESSSVSRHYIHLMDRGFLLNPIGSHSSRLQLGFAYVESDIVVLTLLGHIRLHKSSVVQSVRLSDTPYQNVWQSLDRWASLKTLCPSDASELVHYLTTPIPEGSTLRWPLPHLTHIHLTSKNYTKADDVLQMVRSRKGRCHSARGLTLELPTLLRQLHIPRDCPMDIVTFLRVKTVMGDEGTVIWEGEPAQG